jgi:hypothetical protein
MPSINLLKPTDDNSSRRRVLAFHWVTQTCSKEDLSFHFNACDGMKLAVVLEDGMGYNTDRIKLTYLFLNIGYTSQKLISKNTKTRKYICLLRNTTFCSDKQNLHKGS